MHLNLTTATRYGLNVLALLGISTALYLGRSIFVPLTIAVLLAAILWPSARKLYDRYKLPWFFACLTTVMIVVGFGFFLFVAVASAVPGLVADLPPPNNKEKQNEFYQKLRKGVQNITPSGSETLPENPDESKLYQDLIKTFDEGYIKEAAKVGSNLLYQGVLIFFILLFLLLEGEMLAHKVRNIFGPAPGVQRRVTVAIAEMAAAVRTYLVWRTVVNIGLGIFLGVVYYLLGLKQWHLWAVLTAIFCYVPYIGTIAAGVPPVLDSFLNVGSGQALGIIIFYTAVVTFEGYIIVPWVMGRSMDLNATTVILSCLYWDYVWGIPGLFLAMPLMAGVKAVCLQVDGWRPWGLLMGSGDQADDRAAMDEAEQALLEEESRTPSANIDVDKTVIMESPIPYAR